MTLDYVKKYDFDQEMSDQEITNFVNKLKKSTNEDFGDFDQ